MRKIDRKTELFRYFLLFIAAFLWGSTFVAQSVGMDYIQPFTFSGVRNIIGAIFLIPIVVIIDMIKKKQGFVPSDENGNEITKKQYLKNTLIGGLCCGLVLCFASNAQQMAMVNVSAGKAGFMTAMYVVLVPVCGLIFFKRKVSPVIWGAVALAVAGLYFLSIKPGEMSMGSGELLLLMCALGFTAHILTIDHFVTKSNPVLMSCIQFFVHGIISTILMFIFEQPVLSNILAASGSILYAAILSSGVAYTLQIVGQKDTNPTIASLIMSLESVISVLSGWVVLHDAMSGREIIGCVLMFIAIMISQIF